MRCGIDNHGSHGAGADAARCVGREGHASPETSTLNGQGMSAPVRSRSRRLVGPSEKEIRSKRNDTSELGLKNNWQP